MPGLSHDSLKKLNQLRNQNPDAFSSRVYATVHRIFEGYTFKLTARREIIGLFPAEAMLKSNQPTSRSRPLGGSFMHTSITTATGSSTSGTNPAISIDSHAK